MVVAETEADADAERPAPGVMLRQANGCSSGDGTGSCLGTIPRNRGSRQSSDISLEFALESIGAGKLVAATSTEESPVVGMLADPPCPTKIRESLTHYPGFFNPLQSAQIEAWIEDTVLRGFLGLLGGTSTVDYTPCRTKYFFGSGYTYGRGLRGREELLPLGSVGPIPDWLQHLVIAPLVHSRIIPHGWVDSVVMNDYRAGSSIVAHVDPPRLFARPIVTVSFFCPARLVFGASFDPERRTPPAYSQLLSRGSVLLLDGYAANSVTHGIRPEDMLGARRVSMVLRHLVEVPPQAIIANPEPLVGPWALVPQIQGMWRDASNSGIRTRFYLVQGMLVTVLVSKKADGHSSAFVASGKLAAQAAIWQLLPFGDGLICNTGLLERHCITEESITWQYLHPGSNKTGKQRSQLGFTWVLVED